MEQLKNNAERGQRLLFWLKFSFALSTLSLALGIAIFLTTNQDFATLHAQTIPDDPNLPIFFLILCIILAFGGFVFSIASFVAGVLHLFWLFRTVQNLRQLTTVKFSPWFSVLILFVPFIGQVAYLFMFRHLVTCQQRVLFEKQIHTPFVPIAWLNLWLIFFAFTVLSSFSESTLPLMMPAIAGIGSMFFYIRSLNIFITQEQCIFKQVQDEIFKQKVDSLILERELQKQSEFLKAKYADEMPPADETTPRL